MPLLAHMHKVKQLKDDLDDRKQDQKRHRKPSGNAVSSHRQKRDKRKADHQTEGYDLIFHLLGIFLFSIFEIRTDSPSVFVIVHRYPTIPIKYTTVKIKTHTTSIKCQYKLAT